jgi:predicted metal-dependent HD superfamily phosphohydrolase
VSVSSARLERGLLDRWRAAFPGMADVGSDLISRYGDRARVYHDLRHLSEVLAGVDLLRAECADPQAVELAAWFHDAVYELGSPDNEAASAALAGRLLAPYLDSGLVAEVERLALLTRDHSVEAGDTNGAVLCDADLAVLAGRPEAYDEYAARVRREFAHVPDDAFRAGRADVLRALLALPQLYNTRHGRGAWEAPARANLTRELTALHSLR